MLLFLNYNNTLKLYSDGLFYIYVRRIAAV